MSGDHTGGSADVIGGDPPRRREASERSDRWLDRARLVLKHWKSWVTAAALGLATWGLYGIGGWTLDTTIFAFATLLLLVYRLVTLARDARTI